jgi:hypothetical protein
MIILQRLQLDPHSFPLAERLIHDFPHPRIEATYKTCQNHNIEDLTQQLSQIKNSRVSHTMKYIPSNKKKSKSVRKGRSTKSKRSKSIRKERVDKKPPKSRRRRTH